MRSAPTHACVLAAVVVATLARSLGAQANTGAPPTAGHAGHTGAIGAPAGSAAAGAGARAAAPRLGRVAFPTSAAPAARAPFLRGVLWLHSFEYDHAAEAFREAQRLDPDDVMSIWGEALSYTHPLWGQQDAPAARAVLARLAPTRAARLARARTPRERAYLDAVETLYDATLAPDGAPDGARARRDTAYAAAMARLRAAYPADDDAALFSALAGMGVGILTRDSAAYARAADVSEAVFRRHPDHPGASHYLIHAVDDPAHARRGLAAARAYTDLAPDAGHAQHMTSHIFVALGMWNDVVAANQRALATVAQTTPGVVRVTPHDAYWLGYGLLQQGRLAEARRWTDAMRAQAARDPSGVNRYHAEAMTLVYVADAHAWAAPYLQPGTTADSGGVTGALGAYVRALAAVGRGERGAPDAALARLAAARPAGRQAEGRDRVFELALGGLAAQGAGRGDSAVTLFRAAAAADEALPFMYGPPATVKPPGELAGELFLALGRPAEARAEFARALERTPGRPAALLGLARAQRAVGDAAGAARSYAQLAGIWRDANADVAGVAEVRAAVASGAPARR